MSTPESKKVSTLEVVDNLLVRSDVAYFSGTINSNNIITNNISVVNGIEVADIELTEPLPGSNTITLQSPVLPTGSYTLTFPPDDGINTQILITDGSGNLSWSTPAGSGDVMGPASSTNNAVSVFNGISGKVVRNSGVIIDSSNNIVTEGSVQSNSSLIVQDPGAGSNTITLQSPTLTSGSYALTFPTDTGSNTQILTTNGSGNLSWTSPNTGDVNGPASAIDNAITRYDGTTGKLVQNSGVLIDDNDNVTVPNTVTVTGSIKSNTSFVMEDPGVGTNTVSLQSPTLGTGSYVLTLPVDTGSNAQVLITDGSGNLSWITTSSSSPGGANTEIQFNDNGSFNASSRLTFDKSSNTTTIFANTQIVQSTANTVQLATYNNTWTTSSYTPAPGDLITWSPSLSQFTTVGIFSVAGTSSDGVTWTSTAMSGGPATNRAFNDLIWVEELGLFVAVGAVGTGRIQTSPDGETWTEHTSGDSIAWLNATWSRKLQLLCIGGFNASNGIATSSDGINWTTRSTPGLAFGVNCVAWSEELELFAALAFNEQIVLTSSDGITWTSATIGGGLFPSQNWTDMVWASRLGIFCACGTGNADIITSSDGTTWSSFTSPVTGQVNERKIDWSQETGLFCTAGFGGGGGVISISSDGQIWTTITFTNSTTNNVRDVVWAPELQNFYVVGTGANAALVESNSDYSNIDFPVDIGTSGITDVTIGGQNISIGTSAPNITIGYENTSITMPGYLSDTTIIGNLSATGSVKASDSITSNDSFVLKDMGGNTLVTLSSSNSQALLQTSTVSGNRRVIDIQGNVRINHMTNSMVTIGTINTTPNVIINAPTFLNNIPTPGGGNVLRILGTGEVIEDTSVRIHKKDETLIENEPGYNIDDVLKLKPKFFTWKKTGIRDLGFIVEDSLEANKAFVYRDEVLGVPKNIRDRSVLAGLVAIAQKHEIDIEYLKEELDSLKSFVGYSEV